MIRTAHRLAAALVTGAAAALLVSCAQQPAATPAPEPQAAQTVEAPLATLPDTSPRGAVPAKVGEKLDIWGPDQAMNPSQHVTVTAVRPVESCTGKGSDSQGRSEAVTPTNGRFVAVDMTIVNEAAYLPSEEAKYVGSTQTYDFVGADGAAYDDVDTLDAFYCSGTDQAFTDMKPGRTYTGTTYLDLPTSAGWLVFGQTQWTGSGYEFEIPAA